MSHTLAAALDDTLLAEGTRTARGARSAVGTLGPESVPAADRPRFLAIGQRVNERYIIEELLGAGGMGVVYRVSDELHPERPLALKTLRAASSGRAGLSMFKSEFRTMTQLRHPHLAQVYDFEAIGEAEDCFFTMDYVAGQDAFTATEGAPWERCLELVVQTLRALSYIHRRKVVHFDLKPDNALVDESGRVRIVDFGIAGGALGERAVVRGTPHYMPPELTAEGAAVDHRADLYSLGIMTFELLFRRLPFDGSSYLDLVRAHHLTPLAIEAHEAARVPAWLAAIVTRLCAKRPDERFRTANAVIEAINREGGRTYELETRETRESYALAGRFVGREAEQEALWSFVRARTSGAEEPAPIALVAGQSGVGKSRLVRELRRLCQLQRLPFVEVDCHEATSRDLAPIARAVSMALPLARSLGGEEVIERHGPQLAKLAAADLPGVAPAPAHPDPDREREALRDAVAEFFVALGERTPWVLYVNDLQWATEGTAAILARLVTRVGRAGRLALVGSYRDDEVEGAPIASLLAETASTARAVRLAPLGAPEIATLLGSMLGVEALQEPFVELVARATAGNPFFVEELLRSLMEHGHVYLEGGEWAAARRIAELPIPARMDDLFRRRASHLPAGARRLLDALALHGEPLGAVAAQEASELDDDAFYAAVSLLRERAMIRGVGGVDGALATAHDRVRETVARELDDAARQALHARLGDALAARGEPALQLDAARHYLESASRRDPAERRLRVAAFLADAALEARRSTLFEAARRQNERALHLVAGMAEAEPLRARLTVELLTVLYLVDGELADRQFAEWIEDARTPGEQADLVVARGYALISRGEYAAAFDAAVDGFARVGFAFPRRPSLARMLFEYARARWALRGRRVEDLADKLPEATDPHYRAFGQMLAVAGMSGSWVSTAAIGTVSAIAVRLALRHGAVPNAATMMLGFGALMAAVTGDHAAGHAFIRLGRRLADRFDNPRFDASVHGFGECFVGVWNAPVERALDAIRRSYHLCLARAEMMHAAAIANIGITLSFSVAPTAAAWRSEVAAKQELLLWRAKGSIPTISYGMPEQATATVLIVGWMVSGRKLRKNVLPGRSTVARTPVWTSSFSE